MCACGTLGRRPTAALPTLGFKGERLQLARGLGQQDVRFTVEAGHQVRPPRRVLRLPSRCDHLDPCVARSLDHLLSSYLGGRLLARSPRRALLVARKRSRTRQMRAPVVVARRAPAACVRTSSCRRLEGQRHASRHQALCCFLCLCPSHRAWRRPCLVLIFTRLGSLSGGLDRLPTALAILPDPPTLPSRVHNRCPQGVRLAPLCAAS